MRRSASNNSWNSFGIRVLNRRQRVRRVIGYQLNGNMPVGENLSPIWSISWVIVPMR